MIARFVSNKKLLESVKKMADDYRFSAYALDISAGDFDCLHLIFFIETHLGHQLS